MSVCIIDSQCPFMYFCNDSKCEHKPIFPLQWYPILVYFILIPIGAAIVNIVGKSVGLYKVSILMNLLRFDSSASTAVIQPMVAGAALPNVITVLRKRHPFINTSLVDYNIILATLPCNLLGSTLGSFLEKLLPEIVKDTALIVFFSVFAVKFFQKSRTFKPESRQSLLSTTATITETYVPVEPIYSPQQIQRKKKIQQYESSMHLKDIGISLIVFLIFEFFVFLVQGKFSFYQIQPCTWGYFSGLVFLTVSTLFYLEIVRRALKRQHQQYNSLNIALNLDLTKFYHFRMVCIAGFFAGIFQGILGLGSGTFILGIFIALNLHPQVAAATSGYQILFIGIATFIFQFLAQQITLMIGLFLFLVTFIGGGAVTLFLYWFLKRFEDRKVKKYLLIIMFILCAMSAVLVIPMMVQNFISFGWQFFLRIPWKC